MGNLMGMALLFRHKQHVWPCESDIEVFRMFGTGTKGLRWLVATWPAAVLSACGGALGGYFSQMFVYSFLAAAPLGIMPT